VANAEAPAYSTWDDFDTISYLTHNYSKRIFPEDHEIVRIIAASIRERNHLMAGLTHVADIGTGPNLYPALILSSLVAADGTIDLVDKLPQNRQYLSQILTAAQDGNLISDWLKWESLVKACGLSGASLKTIGDLAQVRDGDVFELGKQIYDGITSFFLTCSISPDFRVFQFATEKLLRSVRSGGLVICAHILGSRHYSAGNQTKFPSTFLQLSDVQSVYEPLGSFKYKLVGHETPSDAIREGYMGMAVVIGQVT